MSNRTINRRELLGTGALITGAGIASLTLPAAALADSDQSEQDSAAVGHIYRLQAAFHRAKTNQDIDLMMSLWDPNGTLTVRGNPNSPFVGFDQLKAFWLTSGSFTHKRFSLVPSFKLKIAFQPNGAFLYFECHDIGNYADPSNRYIATDTFLAGTIRRQASDWVFHDMTAGPAAPLDPTTYYYP
jgi:hypothetical protein